MEATRENEHEAGRGQRSDAVAGEGPIMCESRVEAHPEPESSEADAAQAQRGEGHLVAGGEEEVVAGGEEEAMTGIEAGEGVGNETRASSNDVMEREATDTAAGAGKATEQLAEDVIDSSASRGKAATVEEEAEEEVVDNWLPPADDLTIGDALDQQAQAGPSSTEQGQVGESLNRPPIHVLPDAGTRGLTSAAQPRLIDQQLIDEFKREMVSSRTEEAKPSALEDNLSHYFMQSSYGSYVGDSVAAMARRMVSPGGKMTLAEMQAHMLVMKRLVVPEAVVNKLSRVDLELYLRQINSTLRSQWAMNRMASLRPLWTTTEEGFRQLLRDHPELDAHNCHSAGTYLIIVVYRGAAGTRELAGYVGEASDQTVAQRQKQHDDRFSARKEGKLDFDQIAASQRGLYKNDVLETFHITLTQNPVGADVEKQAAWLAKRHFDLFGKRIDVIGGQRIPPTLLLRMVASVDELLFSCFFDTIWKGFPGNELFTDVRFNERIKNIGANGNVPYVSFSNIPESRAQAVKSGGGRVVPQTAAIRRALQNRAIDRVDMLSQSSSCLPAASSMRLPLAPAGRAQNQGVFFSSSTSSLYPASSSRLAPALRAGVGPGTGDLASPRTSGSVISGSSRSSLHHTAPASSQGTSVAEHPILDNDFGSRLSTRLIIGYPCTVTDEGDLSIELGDEVALQLPLAHSLSRGAAELFLVPIGPNDAVCQPMACSSETSYIMRRFSVWIKHAATGERAVYAPYAEEVDFAWDRAFRRMAEAMASKPGADLIVHTERMPDTELIDGIAIRLRDMVARFPLERDSQGRHRLKLPGNTLNHVTYGITDDTREPFPYFDAGAGDSEVMLRVSDSATAWDRVWSALRPAMGPERGKAVGRWAWSALDPTADRRQWRYWPNLV